MRAIWRGDCDGPGSGTSLKLKGTVISDVSDGISQESLAGSTLPAPGKKLNVIIVPAGTARLFTPAN